MVNHLKRKGRAKKKLGKGFKREEELDTIGEDEELRDD
jgi:hypothetical protein